VSGGVEAGHQIEVAVHKDACPEILKALPCRPILHATVFEKKTNPGGKWNVFKRVLAHNYSLYSDLSSFFAAGNSYDVVIATTTRLDHLVGYWFLYWRFRSRGFKRLVLIFIDSVGQYSPDYSRIHFSLKRLPLKYILKLSNPHLTGGQLFLMAESEGQARQYEKLCGVKFFLVPHVTRMPPLGPYYDKSSKASTHAGHSLVLGTFGFTRFDKGLDILQEAIKIVLQQHRELDVRFVVQWTGGYRLPDGVYVDKDPLLENDPRVQYLSAFDNSEEYYDWIAQTNIMILPYRKNFYFDRLSRVAIDAALAGMPFVYPAETWMESFAKEHGAGVAFRAEDPVSLADAIRDAVDKYAELKAMATVRKQSVSEAFSACTFFDIIAKLPNTKK
jgi:glycosyltransferase involved in cell wall biosynthesis